MYKKKKDTVICSVIIWEEKKKKSLLSIFFFFSSIYRCFKNGNKLISVGIIYRYKFLSSFFSFVEYFLSFVRQIARIFQRSFLIPVL